MSSRQQWPKAVAYMNLMDFIAIYPTSVHHYMTQRVPRELDYANSPNSLFYILNAVTQVKVLDCCTAKRAVFCIRNFAGVHLLMD